MNSFLVFKYFDTPDIIHFQIVETQAIEMISVHKL